MRLVITIENLPDYEQYVITWFANVASHHLLGIDIHELAWRAKVNKLSTLNKLYSEASKFLNTLGESPCTMAPPIPLTPNDKRDLFNPCTALDYLGAASRGQTQLLPLPPALSFEFAEYIRVYMPRVTPSTLKRGAVHISSEVFALSVLGAYASRAYKIEDEYGYCFVGVRNPKLVDIAKLNGMVKSVVEAVMNGGGSRLATYVGTASAIALNVRRQHLSEEQGRTYYTSVRITKTGNKTMLKAYEIADLTSLALMIKRLRIASAVYNLVVNYPDKNKMAKDKRARTVRSVIEELSKSLYQYYLYKDPTEIYRVLRVATTKTTLSEIVSYLPSSKRDIVEKLLEIRI